MDIDRMEKLSRSAGTERAPLGRMDQRVLRWFGHVEIINKCRMT